MSSAVKGVVKKAAATAVATATSLAWKRLGWQARAALMGGSFALGTARKLNNIRHKIFGHQPGGSGGKGSGRRRLHTALPSGLPPAAAVLLAHVS